MIPKIVHVTWKDKAILDSSSPMIEHGIRNLIRLNPDYKVIIYDDHEIDQYLKDQLDATDYDLIKNTHIVEKSDIWRLFKIYNEGGLYIDIDRLCNKKLSDVFDDTINWVLPTCNDFDFSHDIMISAPGNPAFLETIKLYLTRRRDKHTSVYFLGPQTYMHAVTTTLFGELINTDPGKDKFEYMRNEISKIPFIKVFRENSQLDTIIYKGDITQQEYDCMKMKLYKDANVGHWTGKW